MQWGTTSHACAAVGWRWPVRGDSCTLRADMDVRSIVVKVNAYVLLADPTWIRTSVTAYYDHVDTIVASYDESSRGWTGRPIDVERCIEALRSVDPAGKIRFVTGRYSMPGHPLVADTAQRQEALDLASEDADWVLQLDTDEVLPSPEALIHMLRRADELSVPAVEWPMRVLYRALRHGGYLQVMDSREHVHFDYPGPVAVRSGTRLTSARRTSTSFLRPAVSGHDRSIQVTRDAEPGEIRVTGLRLDEAIWHNSWARPHRQTLRKVRTWGHSEGLKSAVYIARRWAPSPWTWRYGREWHPFASGLWPELGYVDGLPFGIQDRDRQR